MKISALFERISHVIDYYDIKNVSELAKQLKIMEKLRDETESKSISVCPFFDIEKVASAIENLPDRIVIDNENYTAYYNESNEKVDIRHLVFENATYNAEWHVFSNN